MASRDPGPALRSDPGCRISPLQGSSAETNPELALVPYVAFIEFHLVAAEDSAQLLKRSCAVMLVLGFDVAFNPGRIRGADGKDRVARLPF